jgi:hypothetical protein
MFASRLGPTFVAGYAALIAGLVHTVQSNPAAMVGL